MTELVNGSQSFAMQQRIRGCFMQALNHIKEDDVSSTQIMDFVLNGTPNCSPDERGMHISNSAGYESTGSKE
jgi:hypothetical protein